MANNYDLKTIRKQLIAGDNSCLESIFINESGFCIKNLCRKSTCKQEDAEDIFLEAMINFREKVISSEITFLTSVRNYLYTTCRNMWSARLQHELVVQKRLTDFGRFFEQEYEDDPLERHEMAKDKESMIKLVREAFSQLTEQCRDILHYFYVERYGMREIADLTGLSGADVVKVTKFRCLKKFTNYAKILLDNKGH